MHFNDPFLIYCFYLLAKLMTQFNFEISGFLWQRKCYGGDNFTVFCFDAVAHDCECEEANRTAL